MEQFMNWQVKNFQPRQPPFEDRCSLNISATPTWLFPGRLIWQSRGKSRDFDHTSFSTSDWRTRDLKTSPQPHQCAGHFCFPFSWRWMSFAVSRTLTGRSTNGHIIDLPLLDNCWDAKALLCRGFTRWRPYNTPRMPLLARILDKTTPINCLSKARFQICNDLSWWLTLNQGPRGIRTAAHDAIRTGSSFG